VKKLYKIKMKKRLIITVNIIIKHNGCQF
jgi:hypothetical protein